MTFSIQTDLLRNSRIPKRFWTLGTALYPGRKFCLDYANEFVETFTIRPDDGIGICFRGPSQSCKTFLATYILKRLLQQGVSVCYYTLTDLTDAYFRHLDVSGDSFRARVVGPQIMCFDDVNVPNNRGSVLALLNAVRVRSDEKLPYLICTRLQEEQLLEFYGVPSDLPGATNCVEGDLLTFFQRDLIPVPTPSAKPQIDELNAVAKRPYRLTSKVDDAPRN